MEWEKLLTDSRLGEKSQLTNKVHDGRSEFQKDFDRIVFSPAFRRLQDKTQVFPLPESDFALGKGGYKIILYMAIGIPVVASPVGINKELIQQGFNGYLANDNQEWTNQLYNLLKDRKLLLEMGKNGRKVFEEKYSSEIAFKKLKAVFTQALQYNGNGQKH